MLSLNALLGLGTVLAPVFVAIFVGLGAWSLLPLLVAVLLGGCCCTACVCPCRSRPSRGQPSGGQARLPTRFWVFAAFAALYGIVETMNGNWATLYMANDLGAPTTVASLALTAFWGMVTVGRVLFAAIERGVSRTADLPRAAVCRCRRSGAHRRRCRAARSASASWRLDWPDWAARRCCRSPSASARRNWWRLPHRWLDFLIAFYQMGYGIAAFGVGPLERFTGWTCARFTDWSPSSRWQWQHFHLSSCPGGQRPRLPPRRNWESSGRADLFTSPRQAPYDPMLGANGHARCSQLRREAFRRSADLSRVRQRVSRRRFLTGVDAAERRDHAVGRCASDIAAQWRRPGACLDAATIGRPAAPQEAADNDDVLHWLRTWWGPRQVYGWTAPSDQSWCRGWQRPAIDTRPPWRVRCGGCICKQRPQHGTGDARSG